MTALTPSQHLIEAARRSLTPIEITWELTWRCPLECRHCYLRGLAPEPPLSRARALRLVEELADAGALFLTFTGGEPWDYPHLATVAGAAARRGLALRFFTAATRLPAGGIPWLAGLPLLEISVTLFSHRAATHDRLTGRPGSWRKTLATLHALAAARLPVTLKTPLTRLNLRSLPGLRRLGADLGLPWRVDPLLTPGNAGSPRPLSLRVPDAALRRFLRDPVLGGVDGRHSAGLYCDAGLTAAAITPGGRILPCVQWPQSAGSLRRQSFAAIWRDSPLLRRIRAETEAGRACPDCPDRPRCDRCPGLAWLETGSAWGPAPSSCVMTKSRPG